MDEAGFSPGTVVFPFLNYGDGPTTRDGVHFHVVGTGAAWLQQERCNKMGSLSHFLLLPEVSADPAAGLLEGSTA